MFYRRRLPHWIPTDAIVFVTWRLAGSTPAQRSEPFSREDADLNYRAASGPLWLQQTRIASMLAEALRYGEAVRQSYWLYAWVIMPNHVHVILRPRIELASLRQWLKGRTGRMANRMLGRTGGGPSGETNRSTTGFGPTKNFIN